MSDLQNELAELADRVRPADLLDRVYGTSRGLRRRRRALVGASVVLTGALVAGLLLPGRDDPDPAPIISPTATAAPAPTPTVGPLKARFVPPVTVRGDRKQLKLTLPDGTGVTVSYSRSEDFERAGADASWSFSLNDDDPCCDVVVRSIPPNPRYVGYVLDGTGQRLDAFQTVPMDPNGPGGVDSGYEETEVIWFRYGDWFIGDRELVAGAVGPDLSKYYPDAGKFRFGQTPDGFITAVPASGRRSHPSAMEADVLTGPTLDFWRGLDHSVQFARAGRCTGPAEAPIMEWRGRQICQDGVIVRVSADKSEQSWVRDFLADLRIDKVIQP
ncbi:MAG: hypothetical protein ABIS86_09115 [Streptosporangiaceae bacterium]